MNDTLFHSHHSLSFSMHRRGLAAQLREREMAMQLRCNILTSSTSYPFSSTSTTIFPPTSFFCNRNGGNQRSLLSLETSRMRRRSRNRSTTVVVASSSNTAAPIWDSWKPDNKALSTASPSLSDIIWPSAGAFVAMAISGKIDQMLASRGIWLSIAPMGAVCAILFASPSAPAARKYNVFMAQIGCAAIGVLALSVFGPGWLARSTALSASIAFMIITRSMHPPAASMPLLFIDAAKLHHLSFWYAFFPGAASCILLCLIQEVVCYLKDNFKF